MPAPVRTPEQAGVPHPAVVVMGVTGSGKSTVGIRLAAALACPYVEGDDKHPPENIARMRSGIALTDADREGWLDAIGSEIAAADSVGQGVVAACSALKRRYRDRLRRHDPGIVIVYLELDPETARQRVARRTGHFMPASLVDSQFAALEPPTQDEAAITLDARLPATALVDAAVRALTEAANGGGELRGRLPQPTDRQAG